MGYSESAEYGIKANGRKWKFTVPSIGPITDRIQEGINSWDQAAIENGLRDLGKTAKTILEKIPADEFSPIQETLQFFEEEDLSYEMETFSQEELEELINAHITEMYDYADYNRIWIEP